MPGGTPQPQVPPVDLDKGGRVPAVVNTYNGPSVGWVATDAPTSIEFVFDGGGQTIQTGFGGFLVIPYWLIINDWFIGANAVCNTVIDVWKCPKASFPPTVSNSITGGNPPTLTAAQFAQGNNLTGWNTEINQGDVIAFNVNSLTGGAATKITIGLECQRILGRPG